MKVESTLIQAITGVQQGVDSARNHASQIASAEQTSGGGNPPRIAESLVGLTQDRLQVSASAEVIKAADAMIGSLLDEKA
ncbi:MAG: hypothetical protein RQ736_04240 [Thiogranum sp.]|nr:hypothetical protein [Thiogranum sp.]